LNAVPASPAGHAGLQVGDILISLDGKPVTDVWELQALMSGELVGREVPALILRGGEPLTVTVTIQEAARKG
jgi:S1-C subfamily serine protease